LVWQRFFGLVPVDFPFSDAVRLSCMTASQQSMALDVEIGECADHHEAGLVLGQSAIADVGEAKDPLDNQEGMLAFVSLP